MSKIRLMIVATMLAAIFAVPFGAFAQGSTILDIAAGSSDFDTLEVAVLAADPSIATALSDNNLQLTVLAPNDDAFAKITNLNDIVADQDLLTKILQYHVIVGEFLSGDVIALDGQFVPTLLGPPVLITVDASNNVFVNDSQVIDVDINASNGVIHVIDTVLLPPIPPFVDFVSPPNTGEVTIGAGANIPALDSPGGNVVELNGNPLLLPKDADNNGFDTYIITETVTVNDVTYYGLFVGSSNYVYVQANQVVKSR